MNLRVRFNKILRSERSHPRHWESGARQGDSISDKGIELGRAQDPKGNYLPLL